MALDRQALEELSHEELVAYANINYGLEVNKGYSVPDLISMISRTQQQFKGNDSIKVVNARDTHTEVPPGHVKIRVQPGKYDRIPRPVVIGLNFKLATIPVNKDVIIPEKYLVCLQDALQDTLHQYKDEQGELVTEILQEHAYAFSILERGPAIKKPSTSKKKAKKAVA
jgi:hypothetical protein